MPPALLMEILELREELADARTDGNHARVDELARGVRARQEASLARVAAAFARTEGHDAAPAGATPDRDAGGAMDAGLDDIARELIAIRYFRRFLEEAARHDDERQAGGPPPLD